MKTVNLLKKVGLILLTSTFVLITVANIDQSPAQAGFTCGCGKKAPKKSGH